MQSVKFGDDKVLKWNLGRDLTGVTEALVRLSLGPGTAPVLERIGGMNHPDPEAGIVSLTLVGDTDFGVGKLEEEETYSVEVKTTHPVLGVLTHPDSHAQEYAKVKVLANLAAAA